jgi:uncharacterized membrane protein YkvA (DUF1232 family)
VTFVAPDFRASLERFVFEYEGAHRRVVQYAPAVFHFYARLFSEERLPHSAQTIVNAVLAYFVVPEDLMPEQELGPFGLLDDLYVASYAFRILRRELPGDVLAGAWIGDGNLDDVMDEIYSSSKSEIGKTARQALKLAGLS